MRFLYAGVRRSDPGVLERHPNPSAGKLAKGLCGNLCRCGTYVGVRAAA
jgi:aerobic-type carbon monoxide dehydrogenase small subunit (CoxS/CutS family)